MNAIAQHLADAVNRHDLDALAACFADEFVNETPAHPARSFTGRAQVRQNWSQIFAAVPDLRAEIEHSAEADNTVWLEWHMLGDRRDGSRHEMRGVTVFVHDGDRFTSVRFYLEPVEQGGVGIREAVRSQVHA